MPLIADSFFSWDNIGLYAAIIIFGIQFIVIIYLLISQKSGAEEGKSNGQLSGNYRRCLEKNAAMIVQIESLDKNLVDLQKVNLDLLSQKEILQQSKAQLEELQEKKIELIEMAIHDIKNPAAAIKGYIQLLESYDLNAVEQHSVMKSLFEISSRILDITQEMTELMEKSTPDFSLKLATINITELISNILRNNKGYAQTKDIKLKNNIFAKLPDVEVDKLKIQEVIENLINNAIKYGPKGTLVQVDAAYNDGYLTIEVSDDGFGLPGEDIKMAFQKGSKLSTKPTGDENRSGLGLWIVKRIVEQHGGMVKVRSSVGKGSTFSVILPLKQKTN